jgi:monothiol glutaredoxin
MDVIEQIKNTIAENPVLLFMKGSPDAPQCGFSMRTAEALKASNTEFAYVDILANQEIRANLPKVSNWPTFPQLFINGELVGGCDIVLDLYQKGELQSMLEEVSPSEA